MTGRMFSLLAAALLIMPVFGCARIRPPDGVQGFKREMNVSAYSNSRKDTNWKRNWLLQPVIASGPDKGKPKKVGVTASGTKARHGTIAADTTRYPFGTVMFVPGYGWGRVEDRGSAIKGDKLDLWHSSRKKARAWGRKQLTVTIWLPPGWQPPD